MKVSLKTILQLTLLTTLAALMPVAVFAGGPANATATAELQLRGDADAASAAWPAIEQGALVIDVRSEREFAGGHLDQALNIAHTDIDGISEAIGTDFGRPVVLYCGSGKRAEIARTMLMELGYSNVINASGLDALEATRPEE